MRGLKSNGEPRWSDGKPLGAAMDNVLAAKLGRVALAAGERKPGMAESIDFGLRLLHMLDEAGFEVREKQ